MELFKYAAYMRDLILIAGVPGEAVMFYIPDGRYALVENFNDYMAEEGGEQEKLESQYDYDWHPDGLQFSEDPIQLLYSMGNFNKPSELSARDVVRAGHKLMSSYELEERYVCQQAEEADMLIRHLVRWAYGSDEMTQTPFPDVDELELHVGGMSAILGNSRAIAFHIPETRLYCFALRRDEVEDGENLDAGKRFRHCVEYSAFVESFAKGYMFWAWTFEMSEILLAHKTLTEVEQLRKESQYNSFSIEKSQKYVSLAMKEMSYDPYELNLDVARLHEGYNLEKQIVADMIKESGLPQKKPIVQPEKSKVIVENKPILSIYEYWGDIGYYHERKVNPDNQINYRASLYAEGDNETGKLIKLKFEVHGASPEEQQEYWKRLRGYLKHPPRYPHPIPGIGCAPNSIPALFAIANHIFRPDESDGAGKEFIYSEGKVYPGTMMSLIPT